MIKLAHYSTKQLYAIGIIGIMMMMESIDTNILNVAIPSMSQSLQVTPLHLKIAITSYLISLSIFTPISGCLADKFGTKNILILSIFSFGLSSFLCGMAHTLPQLVCFRILQGAAGALLVPVGRLLMLKVFPKQDLVKVYMFISMPLLLGPLLAPYIGGLLVTYFNWRYIFYVNVPFTIVTLYATVRYVENFTQETKPFNWPSFFMLAIFLAATAYWLDTAIDIASFSAQLINAAVIFIALLAYLFIELRSTHKIVNYHLFNIRTYQLCFLSSAISRITLGARSFVIVLYLQLALTMSAVDSGFLISSMAVGYLLSRIFISKFLKTLRFKKMLNICNLGTVIGTLLLCFVQDTNAFAFIVIIAIGFFSAVVLLLLNVLCFADVGPEAYASATSLNSTTQQLFVAIGVTLAAGLLYLFNYFYGTFSIYSFYAVFIVITVITFIGQWPFWKLRDSDGDNLV